MGDDGTWRDVFVFVDYLRCPIIGAWPSLQACTAGVYGSRTLIQSLNTSTWTNYFGSVKAYCRSQCRGIHVLYTWVHCIMIYGSEAQFEVTQRYLYLESTELCA